MDSVYAIHDEGGRILAVADAAKVAGPGGMTLRHQPSPRPGQRAVLVHLRDEQRDMHALALVRDYRLDRDASPPVLYRGSR
jgi:hypothetical protein